MASFCIVRCEKLHTRGNVAASIKHTFRDNPTPNADPARRHLNRTIGGASQAEIFAAMDARHELAAQRRLELEGKRDRHNAVPMVEYIVTASPEAMASWDAAKVDAFFADVQRWLIERHGAENVLSTSIHFDETTPHLVAYVVPIGPRGTLSAGHWTKKAALSKLQTDFHVQCGRAFGLDRGIEGSKAKHGDVKRFHGQVNAPTPGIATPRPAAVAEPTAMERISRSSRHDDATAAAARQTKKRNAEIAARDAALVAKAKQLELDRGKLASREAQLKRATFAREIPLIDVIKRLGAKPDSRDKENWDTAAGRISIGIDKRQGAGSSTKFYNHDQGRGGGGAIDLVMHVEDCDYKTALRWLLDAFGDASVESEVLARVKREVADVKAEPRPPYEPPAASPERWPRVRAYLVDVRRLAARLVDALHSVGRIYADARSNAVFQLGPNDAGVELRGTSKSTFHGVRGKKGVFNLPADGDDRRVAFVESSIEAMSLRCLGFKGRVLGFAGSSPDLQQLYASTLIAEGYQVVAAFNADEPGDRMAAALIATAPGVVRARPPSSKDWNDELVARAGQAVVAWTDVEQPKPVEDPPIDAPRL